LRYRVSKINVCVNEGASSGIKTISGQQVAVITDAATNGANEEWVPGVGLTTEIDQIKCTEIDVPNGVRVQQWTNVYHIDHGLVYTHADFSDGSKHEWGINLLD